MFPLSFPYSILKRHAYEDEWVLDPFCGRGTTNYASRLLGLPSVGIDSSRVAAALTDAKLANTDAGAILRAAQHILDEIEIAGEIPTGEFWQRAFHREVLKNICRLREGLLKDCRSDARKALRAILMGALHGPQGKTQQSYLSNQCPRTYAPKPGYAVKFWKENNIRALKVNVLEIIANRANRYFEDEPKTAVGNIMCGDSRNPNLYARLEKNARFDWIITSPPYYGMDTYIADQWLRYWFVGGSAQVDYSRPLQLTHASPEEFSLELRQVWENVGTCCNEKAKMVVRFGGINNKAVESVSLLKKSLKDTGWKIETIKSAGTASKGYRQALHFAEKQSNAIEEHDIWAVWEN